jgi:hypothetical protein
LLADSKDAAGAFFMDPRAGNLYNTLGQDDGVGFLLRTAAFHVDENGISHEELARFRDEGSLLIDTACSSLLNFSVVLSLLLTIFVTLQIIHVDRELDDRASLIETSMGNGSSAAAAPADSWPMDLRGVRWWAYVGECVFASLGTYTCLFNLIRAIQQYSALANLPTVVSKCEYIMTDLSRLSSSWNGSRPAIELGT